MLKEVKEVISSQTVRRVCFKESMVLWKKNYGTTVNYSYLY